MLLTFGLHKNSLVRSYSEHRILTPKIPKQSEKTVVTILVTTVSIFRMVLSASRRLPCGERPEGGRLFCGCSLKKFLRLILKNNPCYFCRAGI